MVATASDDDVLCSLPCRMMHRPLSMSGINPILATAIQDRVGGHEPTFVEDADAIGKLMDFDDAPGAVGNAVIVAADRDQAIMADATLQFEKGIEGTGRQGLKFSGCSATKASLTMRCVVPCRRTLATVSSQPRN
jgi:hypothetical protein